MYGERGIMDTGMGMLDLIGYIEEWVKHYYLTFQPAPDGLLPRTEAMEQHLGLTDTNAGKPLRQRMLYIWSVIKSKIEKRDEHIEVP